MFVSGSNPATCQLPSTTRPHTSIPPCSVPQGLLPRSQHGDEMLTAKTCCSILPCQPCYATAVCESCHGSLWIIHGHVGFTCLCAPCGWRGNKDLLCDVLARQRHKWQQPEPSPAFIAGLELAGSSPNGAGVPRRGGGRVMKCPCCGARVIGNGPWGCGTGEWHCCTSKS